MAGNGPGEDAAPGAGRPDHERPDDDWPGDEWTDDDWPADNWPDDDAAGAGESRERAWAAAPLPGPPPRGNAPGWRSYPLLVAVVAVVAAAAGAALVLLIANGPSGSPSAGGSQPSTAPSQGAGGGIPGSGGPGGPAGPGAGHLQALIVGKVAAVSSTSITLAGQGNSITAAVTRATKVSGKVRSISGVRVGDQVLAQLTGTGRTFTATTIQDPASIS